MCAGCGGSGRTRTILETKRTIVALALHGSDVAWLAGAPTSSCRISLWLRTPKGTTVLPLPHAVSSARFDDCSVFGSYGFAAIALSGASVAWLMNEPGAYTGAVSEGASSAQPRTTATLVRVPTESGIVSPVGASIGGVAATSAGLVWGTAHVAYRRTLRDDGACDLDLTGVGCQTRVDGGGVFAWSGGTSGRIAGLPPATALASAGGLLAVATRPVGPWIHGASRAGSVQVRDERNRVVTSVPSPQEIVGLALSRQLLAVGDGLDEHRLGLRGAVGPIPVAHTPEPGADDAHRGGRDARSSCGIRSTWSPSIRGAAAAARSSASPRRLAPQAPSTGP